MAVRTPRAARRPPQRAAPPAERQPACGAPRFPQRDRTGHTTPAALTARAREFRKSIHPPRCHLRQQIGMHALVVLLTHQAAAALASRRERPAQRRTRSQNGHPADPVRGRPWKSRRCAPTVLTPRTPSAIRPWTPRRTKAKLDFWRLFDFRHRRDGYRRGEDPRRMPGFSPGPREAFGALAWRFQRGDRAAAGPRGLHGRSSRFSRPIRPG